MKVIIDIPEKEANVFLQQIKGRKFEILDDYNEIHISDDLFKTLLERSKTPLSLCEDARDVLSSMREKHVL
jgi:hypothetical protein